jgi:DNA polymerase
MTQSPDTLDRAARAAQRAARDGSWNGDAPGSLEEVVAGVQLCRRCELWRDATHGVPGEGPAHPTLMLVGEQPGDQEDLEGRPFVGPAGRVLDAGLQRAGVERAQVFVTNAVRHFRHEMRGKVRLHKTPDAGQVSACRWWLDAERRLVRPKVVLALGATASLAVFGKALPIGQTRGKPLPLDARTRGLVTYHPSYLLRLPDEAAKKAAFKLFVEDLRLAWTLTGPSPLAGEGGRGAVG